MHPCDDPQLSWIQQQIKIKRIIDFKEKKGRNNELTHRVK